MIKAISLDHSKWKIFDDKNYFHKEAIHIFRISAIDYYNIVRFSYDEILSDLEMAKASRFIKKDDAERFIASKHSLRFILSKFISAAPAAIQFQQFGNKKPIVNGIEFNMTHSKNLILIAVGPSSIGIDIEYVNSNFDYGILVHNCFSPEEQRYINSQLTFYRSWTRKEALLKATGEGITNQMQEITCMDKQTSRLGKEYEIKTFHMEEQQYVFSIAATALVDKDLNFWSFC